MSWHESNIEEIGPQSPLRVTLREGAMELGHPTVVNENISVDRGHTLAITKIRQWTPNSNVKVWFGDPARGVWKTNWNTMANPNFNQGNYLFYLR
jgi:hypothetical protein